MKTTTNTASATDTQVSKSSKGVKALIACFPQWKGRRVRVREVGPDWCHVHYLGDQVNAVVVDLSDGHMNWLQAPRLGGPAVAYRAVSGCALVLLSRFMGEDMGVEIVVETGAIDAAAVAVATDALLSRNTRGARIAAETCGVFAGIALAMAEARAKLLAKGEAAAIAA